MSERDLTRSNRSSQIKSKDEKSLNKVKIFKPFAFVIDFHGTICSMKWEDEVILPFVIENLNNYLIENWGIIDLMNLIDTLRHESFVQRFQFSRNDAPLIEDDSENLEMVRKSICDFVKWQIGSRKETNACINLQRLIWHKGMIENKVKTIIFDDVPDVLRDWKSKSIKIYIMSNLSKDELSFFLKYTSHGDLTDLITDYFDGSIGKRILKETYLEIAKRINCDIKNLVFITDSGKIAKMASEAGADSLIILRPKNYRIREYYLTCFQSITSFNEIELVHKSQFLKG